MHFSFGGIPHNGHCEALLSVEEKGRQCIFDAVAFFFVSKLSENI
jgi:hypothetical protein